MKVLTIKQPWATLIMQKEMLLKENKDIYTDSSFKENYGWQLENVEVFDEPIEAKGKLSLWEYDLKEK